MPTASQNKLFKAKLRTANKTTTHQLIHCISYQDKNPTSNQFHSRKLAQRQAFAMSLLDGFLGILEAPDVAPSVVPEVCTTGCISLVVHEWCI